ncbi:lytic murein transglycosylase B [Leptothrix cholodnii SP-6]|uniref:Lytic murein transglycosylase B n=1 Tax=Leptothrix cholodnii (strain ATCC 51168 / LMG 8142 / SP-6) TaxID=395495 RepID=B1Y245_LEPCP|nr:lytic murein transglycosylase B [Leptothrix cholodnii]ACB34344.1 lytic murein transglycosylase B [Leptothrix cholodnii SP-6]
MFLPIRPEPVRSHMRLAESPTWPIPGRRAIRAAFIAFLIAAVSGALLAGPAEANTRPHKSRRTAVKPQPVTPPYGLRDDVQDYIRQVTQAHPDWPADWVATTIGQARHLPQVTRLIMPPPTGTAKNWAAYRARFVEPQRITAGMAFWSQHADALARAEATYGVPAAVIVGIVGVETYYGRHTGRLRTVDALASLAFDFPSGRSDRSAFFRSELTALLELALRDGLDLGTLRGSYAGALGWPQFMPSSWLRHAVDFDGDGRIALHDSPVDAIGSIGRFLAAHGWQRGLAVAYGVSPPDDEAALATLLAPDIRPSFSAAQMGQLGAALDEDALVHPGPLALVQLHNGAEAPSYVAGTENFWSLTRYNWSSYYAMAVIELGQAVAAQRPASPR